MKSLFVYNWQVRDEWLEWCKNRSEEELLLERKGGMGNFLHTFVHVIDVEYSWIRALQGKPDFELIFDEYRTIESVILLSNSLRGEVEGYIDTFSEEMENTPVKVSWNDEEYTHGEVVRHVIAHEIHHIGQLSVWARELGIKPVSANFIGRKIMSRLATEKKWRD